MGEFKVVSPVECDTLMAILTQKIKDSGIHLDRIYGVPRGGLPVAVFLSHHLKLPLVVSMVRTPGVVLVVDDVADTGSTLEKYATLSGLVIATLHYKPWSKVVPDFYVAETEAWIQYPWEAPDEERVASYRK